MWIILLVVILLVVILLISFYKEILGLIWVLLCGVLIFSIMAGIAYAGSYGFLYIFTEIIKLGVSARTLGAVIGLFAAVILTCSVNANH